MTWVRDAIEQILIKGIEGLNATESVGFNFCTKDFARGDGWVLSNSTALNTETFCLGITSVKMPAGKRSLAKKFNNFNERDRRWGIIVVNNKGNLCRPRALVK